MIDDDIVIIIIIIISASASEISTRAETFGKNQQNLAREPRHSTQISRNEHASQDILHKSTELSTRAQTFDTN